MKLHENVVIGLRHTSIVIPADQRPVCQYCARTLRLYSRTIWFDMEARARLTEKYLKGALAWSKFEGSPKEPRMVDVWAGEYHGYGCDKNGVPLFCTQACGISFATSCYHGGRRIRHNDSQLTR